MSQFSELACKNRGKNATEEIQKAVKITRTNQNSQAYLLSLRKVWLILISILSKMRTRRYIERGHLSLRVNVPHPPCPLLLVQHFSMARVIGLKVSRKVQNTGEPMPNFFKGWT